VDGNLARCVRPQPYGDFVDAMSSYTLIALLGISLGFCAYRNGGVIFEPHSAVVMLLGALASVSDSLMRLCYQKFKNNTAELENSGVLKPEKDVRTDHESVTSITVRIEHVFGTGTLLPIVIFVCSLLGALDIAVIYMFFYYTGSAVVIILKYIRKAMSCKNIPMK
jgi:hypothetical protein